MALLPGCTVERAALMPTMARLQNGQRAELVAENEAADALRDWANDCDVDDLKQLMQDRGVLPSSQFSTASDLQMISQLHERLAGRAANFSCEPVELRVKDNGDNQCLQRARHLRRWLREHGRGDLADVFLPAHLQPQQLPQQE